MLQNKREVLLHPQCVSSSSVKLQTKIPEQKINKPYEQIQKFFS